MFKDYHVYAAATGNVTFPDAWQSGDFHALWVGLHGWQQWKEDPKNGGYARGQWLVHDTVRACCAACRPTTLEQEDPLLQEQGGLPQAQARYPSRPKAGQLGRVNEKPEDHLDMLEIVTIAPKTGAKRKRNTTGDALSPA